MSASEETNERAPAHGQMPMAMNKTLMWFGMLMAACTLALIAVLFRAATPSGRTGEGEVEAVQAAARLAPGGQTQSRLPDHAIPLPAGLGGQQMQMIDARLPAGLGGQQMQLIKNDGPYLGLGLSDIAPETAASLGIAVGSGVSVPTVLPGSPGAKAGIVPGDVLSRLDNKDLGVPGDVGQILSTKKAGDAVKAVVNHAGSKKSVQITLANAPLGLDLGQGAGGPWFGADIQDIDEIMRIQFNLPDSKGVIISHVAPGSPAAAAGLAVGDMIRKAGETRVRDVAQFQSIVGRGKIGQTLRLSVMRAGRLADADVTLAAMPPSPQTVPFVAPADVVVEAAWIGMDVAELANKDVAALGLPAGTRGILVNDVEGPPAMTVGFQSGDVIVAINHMAPPDVKSFSAATSQQTGAVVEVLRGVKHVFLSVPPPGYTQQGTRVNTGIDKKFRQVAAVRPGIVAFLNSDKDLRSQIGAEAAAKSVILVDLGQRAYAMLELRGQGPLPDLLAQNGVSALVCSDITAQTAAALRQRGIAVYKGVVGSVLDGVSLYESQGLAPASGP
ncbi:MAG: PDZ domain-containing protein [Desulfovibrionaceae bacterium]|nr:PDZ domain-containing protein [Desulfovibrionaceae bacterium]